MGICFHKTQEISVSSSPSAPSRPRNRYHIKKPSLRRTRPLPPILPRPVSKRQTGRVLGRPFDDIRAVYEMGGELGRGQFGITYMCRERATGVEYACKSISRQKYRREEGAEELRREISVMQHLSGHPNIVKFKGVYEERHNLHLVMELCSGGELFDRIVEKGSYSERTAACLFTQILKVIHVCHFMGVIHRDLKPENFLFVTRDDDSPLKVTDFGLSVFVQEGKAYHDFAGSSYYIAPEVLQSSYGKEIDIWSAGIILYILLSGAPPFLADTERGIFQAIKETNLDLQSPPWPSISHLGKDLVRRMLARNPKHRITASQALQHPWLREDCSAASKKPMDSAVLHRMKQFKAMNKMKKLALKVIAEKLTEEEINGLKATFNNMDTDRSGMITVEELRIGLGLLGSRPTEAEIEQLIVAVDVDCSRTLDYLEFITATMHLHRLHREDILLKAFCHFDTDDSGYITKREVVKAVEESGGCEKWGTDMDVIMNDIDTNTDGKINYEEFVCMMRTGPPPA